MSDFRNFSTYAFVVAYVLISRVATAEESVAIDLLVVAPHSDDEAIGCSGTIMRAVARGERVGVVVVTAGDGFAKAAAAAAKKSADRLSPDDFLALAALRQRHTLEAMPRLGVKTSDIYFLGYPDGGLDAIYRAEPKATFCSPLTGRSATYGVVVADYRSQVDGRPSPYAKEAVIADLAEIIRKRRPREIYVTHELDSHADHRASCRFVGEAATAAHFNGELWTFVVHGDGPTSAPDRILRLTAAEQSRKQAVLQIYEAGVEPVHDDLAEKFALPEERFWRSR